MSKSNKLYNIKSLCETLKENSKINQSLYEKFNVCRGLRKPDGTGVVVGITNICNVHGYVVDEGERRPIPGELIYRGYNIADILKNVEESGRFGFEETVFLLIFGQIPNKETLDAFSKQFAELRELPDDFAIDMIYKAPSKNIMNKLARAMLALYSYDDNVEDTSIENEVNTAISLIAKMPVIMTAAYHVKKHHYSDGTFFMHSIKPEENTAQSILSLLRPTREYTDEEAKLLDAMLIIHAEHSGGNNSTFACRTLTSSGTDPYSAFSAAIGSLKGPKHGGANIKVMEMLEDFKNNVDDWTNEGQIADHMRKILNKQANDFSGLIYGMGHAVYTVSDPRAIILKEKLAKYLNDPELEAEFNILQTIERLTPEIFKEFKNDPKDICANVDMYSGLVYKMLKIPQDLFTPLFAISRMAGWAAHRMEELLTCKRIIRPAYKAIYSPREYPKGEIS